MRRLALTLCLIFYSTLAFATSGPGTIGPHVLAQSNPPAAILTTIYTAPHYGEVISVWFANRDNAHTHYIRMALAPLGAANSAEQYIYYDVAIPPISSMIQFVNLPLQPTDQIRVWADAQQVSFSLFGNMQP